MGVNALLAELGKHSRALLDTNIFSYHLSDHPRYSALTSAILERIEAGALAGVTTTLTLAELLTSPAKAGDERALADYELFLTSFPNLEIVPLDNAVARATALVRAATGLRTPDAIQIAAARVHQVGIILTNDKLWSARVTQPQVLLLDSYVD